MVIISHGSASHLVFCVLLLLLLVSDSFVCGIYTENADVHWSDEQTNPAKGKGEKMRFAGTQHIDDPRQQEHWMNINPVPERAGILDWVSQINQVVRLDVRMQPAKPIEVSWHGGLDWEPRNVRQYNQINCGFWYESLLKLVGASNDYTDCSGVVVSRLGYWYPFGHSALRVSPRYQEDMHVSRPTAFDVSFDATIEYDKPSAILTAFGLVVFVMAPLITKSNKAYMTTTTLLGMALGLAILLVMVVMLMSRMFPQRGKLAALATGVGFGGVLITKTSARLVGLLADNVVFVGIYAIVSGCIAFGVAYRTAFFQHEQTKQLLQWMIQLSAVLVIVLNSCNFFVLLGMIGTLLGRSTLASLLYYTSKYWTFVVFMPYYVVVEGRRAWQRKKGGRKANVGGYGSGSGGGEEEEDASSLRSMLREDAVPVAAMLGGSVGAVFSSERAFTSPNGNKYTPKMRRSTRRKFLESKNVDVNKFDVLGAAEYVTEAEYEQSMSDTTKQELAKLMQRVAQGGEFVHLLSPIAKKRVGEALSYYEDEQNMDEDL